MVQLPANSPKKVIKIAPNINSIQKEEPKEIKKEETK